MKYKRYMRRNRRQVLENLQHPPGVYQHLFSDSLLPIHANLTMQWPPHCSKCTTTTLSSSWCDRDVKILNIAAKVWTDVEDANNDATEDFLRIMQSDTLGVPIQILMLVLFNAT